MKLSLPISLDLLLLLTLLSGCAPTPRPVSIATASPAASSTLAFTATHRPTQIVATQLPPLTPIPSPTPGPTLSVRKPTPQELFDYLAQAFSDFDSGGFLGDVTDLSGTDYEDVNGDGELDLVVLNPPDIYILLWNDQHYLFPFRQQAGFLRGGPASSYTFQDWTADGVPEVVFDNSEMGGGTGLFIYDTTRYIILCQQTSCHEIWEGLISRFIDDENAGGVGNYRADLRLNHDQSGGLSLRYVYGGFSIYTQSPDIPADPALDWQTDISHLKVSATTTTEYRWDGSSFIPADQQELSPAYVVNSKATLSAIGPAGVAASIAVSAEQDVSFLNDRCQFAIAKRAVGEPFGCKGNFTTVEWKDITNDGRPEVVVTALSGGEANGPTYQHLLAYTWKNQTATLVADVTGAVLHPDLFGIRFDDVDQDGQLEIIAGGSDGSYGGQAFNSLFKWNGDKFAFWHKVLDRP